MFVQGPYHREMLVALIFYGHATGVFFSRKLALATQDSIAFRYYQALGMTFQENLPVLHLGWSAWLAP